MTDIERLAVAIGYLTRSWVECEEADGKLVRIRHEALLAQLGYAALIKGSGEPSHGSNPNKAGSRPPGNQAPLNLLDRISEEGQAAYIEAQELKGVSDVSVVRTRNIPYVLHDLMGCALALQHQHPRHVARMAKLGESWVESARLMLGYASRSVMLRDVSCDQCGGALSVPVDASGDVVCAGIPSCDPQEAQEPCGRVYPRWSWPDLLAEQTNGSLVLWTTREAVAYIVREHQAMRSATATRWLYNQAREGKITNHGNSRKAMWNSSEVLDQMSWFVGA